MVEYVQTNIRVDKAKKELALKKGLVLTKIFDDALDVALQIETQESTVLLNEKEMLQFELDNLEEKKNNFLKQYEESKSAIEFKINNINQALKNAVAIEENEAQKQSFDKLVNEVYNGKKIGEIADLINAHADKYDLDVMELRESILDEIDSKKYD